MGAEVKSMDIKKAQQNSTTNHTFAKKKVENFVTEMKEEVQKVQWTSKEELIVYSKIVIITTFVFGMAIYMIDLLIQGFLIGLSVLLSIITG